MRILVHPDPIRVNYKVVRELVPTLWEETYAGRKIDVVIHMGMAGPRLMYQIESRGHRTGYKSLDVDGKHLDELDGKRDEEWIWHGLPDVLKTDLNIQDIWQRWQQHSSVRILILMPWLLSVAITDMMLRRMTWIFESLTMLAVISVTSSTTQVWQPAISRTRRGRSSSSTCLRIALKP